VLDQGCNTTLYPNILTDIFHIPFYGIFFTFYFSLNFAKFSFVHSSVLPLSLWWDMCELVFGIKCFWNQGYRLVLKDIIFCLLITTYWMDKFNALLKFSLKNFMFFYVYMTRTFWIIIDEPSMAAKTIRKYMSEHNFIADSHFW